MRSHPIATIALSVFFGAALLAQQAQQAQAPPAAGQPAAAQAPRRAASPPGTASIQVLGEYTKTAPDAPERYTNGKWIEITYSRPILRGRTNIFGSGADYGKKVKGTDTVWRAGANNTTRLMTEVPLVFGGKTLPAGEYSVFLDIKPNDWTLIFSNQPFQVKYDPNNKTETWGATNYDQKFDVLRVPMKVSTSAYSLEQFTIEFLDVTKTGGTLMMAWEKTAASVPFTVGK